VDTNVLLDVVLDDPGWSTWSLKALETGHARDTLAVNAVIYAELSAAFARIEELEQVLTEGGLAMEPIPREALFLAGKVFMKYRRRQGVKTKVLPDFFIGAHAAVTEAAILTRDVGRYRACFPTVTLVTPTRVPGADRAADSDRLKAPEPSGSAIASASRSSLVRTVDSRRKRVQSESGPSTKQLLRASAARPLTAGGQRVPRVREKATVRQSTK